VTWLALLAAWLLAPTGAWAEDSAPAKASAPALVGSQWRWVRTRMNDDSVHEPGAEASRPYTVAFEEEGRLTIRADCNRMLGTWEQSGSSVTLQAAGPMTLVACPGGSLADVFLADLSAAAVHFFHDGDLYLDLKYDSGTMQLSPISMDLAGTRWQVTSYNNGKEAVVSVLSGTELTAAFESKGRLVGHAGCNRYQAPYEADGDSVSIGPPAVTRMHCAEPEGVMDQERLFLVALQQAAHRTFDGERLELRTANGALAVTLVAALDEARSP
jgi:heat shock protein HslJ